MLGKAREERERCVGVRKREEEAKAVGNCKPPERKDSKRRAAVVGCPSHILAAMLHLGGNV